MERLHGIYIYISLIVIKIGSKKVEIKEIEP